MPTYSKETALYDTGRIAADIGSARNTAKGYMTEVTGDNGVFVHEYDLNDPQPSTAGANGVHITSDVDIIRNGKVAASYGEKAKIGVDNEGQLIIDSNSLEFIDDLESTSFSIKNIKSSESGTVVDRIIYKANAVGVGTYTHKLKHQYLGDLGVDFIFGDPEGSAYLNDCSKHIALSNFGSWSINSSIGFTASGTISFDSTENTVTLVIDSMSGQSTYKLVYFSADYSSYPQYPTIAIGEYADLSEADEDALIIGLPGYMASYNIGNAFAFARQGYIKTYAGLGLRIDGHEGPIGDVHTYGAWIAEGTVSGTGSILTNRLTLTTGTFILMLQAPTMSGTATCRLADIDVGTKYYRFEHSYETAMVIVKVDSTIHPRIELAQSGSVTFSNPGRGGLIAVRIA